MTKLEHTKELIHSSVTDSSAVLLSFGKDSMVLAHLIREVAPRNPMRTHDFPIPVIYFRDPWFPFKNMFADSIIRSWAMEVHDWQPMAAGIKVKEDMLELVSRYPFAGREMDIPKNVCAPEEYPRRDYICGLNDWVLRPKSGRTTFPWDTVFHGHKSSDVDPFEGHVPLEADSVTAGSASVVFPLRHWTDDDVWDYIEDHNIPIQESRYLAAVHEERDDKWWNNDYVHACTACIDPRNDKEVHCPKLNKTVPNVGNQVLRIQALPDYIADAKLKRKLEVA
jgi:hypothetical protein